MSDSIQLDINELRKYLPHRYPFLLIDKVIDVQPGKSIVAIKNVTINEPFFSGHFPIAPVMPGVLIIEALAQTSGILTFLTEQRYPAEKELFYLAGIDNARFKRMVIPGDILRLEVELLKHRHGLWKFSSVALVEDEVACTAEFMNIQGRDHNE